MLSRFYIGILTILAFAIASNAAEITITDASINAGESKTWTKDNVYILDGFVFVENGATLNIDAGTVIKGKPGQGENASALIIARGGKIFANGTKEEPVIFTYEADDPNDYSDQPLDATGQWGGIIILGYAVINEPGGEANVEGIPTSEPRGMYGGNNDNDNSGVFKYVSIRHGGTDIGANNEINGLTLGGVGDGTEIHHIEVFANADDGIEFFGGTVNTRNIVVAFCDDDSYDWDQGFRGKGQFWFTIQSPKKGNNFGEHDGGDTKKDAEPYTIPTIYNATMIGSGSDGGFDKSRGFHIRENSGGHYINSIFTDCGGRAIEIEDLGEGIVDSEQRLAEGDLTLLNNIWWNFKGGNDLATHIAPDIDPGSGDQQFVRDYLSNPDNLNTIENPVLQGVSRNPDGGLIPVPGDNSPAFTKSALEFPEGHNFFKSAPYIGAFGPSTKNYWISGWTLLDQSGYLGTPSNKPGIVQVLDDDIKAGDDIQWTNNNTYILNGFVFVDNGATLRIQEGTVIKGKPGQGENASALIVARGGKIFAEGTAENPIIFTYEADDPFDINDQPLDATGQWGGVIILGNAVINEPSGEANVEGIPTSEPRGIYGGNNDNENSGVFKYVSIRHGGTDIGANNEINGLTLGGVGDGTEIHHIEVFANADDGIEFFGGTVNTRNIVVAFCDDDSYDWDQGFRGKGQFWFTIQSPKKGNNFGEHDGGDTKKDAEPYTIPTIYNATMIGSGSDGGFDKSRGFHIRENSGGHYINSIFTDCGGRAIEIEDLGEGIVDSEQRLAEGDLTLLNNIWWNFKGGNDLATHIAPDIDPGSGDQQFVRDYLSNPDNHNYIQDPLIQGISRSNNGGLIPTFGDNSPAYTLPRAEYPKDQFFTPVDYYGAFGTDVSDPIAWWAKGWSFIDNAGYLGTPTFTGVEDDVKEGLMEITNFPNPFTSSTTITFNVAVAGNVKLTVVDMLGTEVANLFEASLEAGVKSVSFYANDVVSGTYFVRLETASGVATHQIAVVK